MNPMGSSFINYSSSTTTLPFNSVDKTTHTVREIDQFYNSSESSLMDLDDGKSHLTTTFEHMERLNVIYASSEAVVAFLAIVGNLLVVYVFSTNRSLRRYRNYYIVGLAVADFLVGLLGIPLAVLASVGLPRHLYGCLFTVSVLMVLCTVSILCLVAVSIDRYWATTNPFAYYRNMTTSTSVGIILTCWLVGAIIGFLPLFGWYNHQGFSEDYCMFVKVMDYNYLVFLYFATIIFPAILMACFYGYIYHIVLIKIRQKGTLAPAGGRRPSEASRSGSLNSDLRGSTQMMRIIVSEKRREAKAAKKLSIIVLFFMICWMPLYTINCIQAFCSSCTFPQPLMEITIILSHANSALNPFLYAYHLKEFRLAMKNVLCACFSRLFCNCFASSVQKEASSTVSRSQTMPSIGNNAHQSTGNIMSTALTHSQALAAGKYSIKFRKDVDSTRGGESNYTNRRQLSPERARRLMASSTPSRDNLLHPVNPVLKVSAKSQPNSSGTKNSLSQNNSSKDNSLEFPTVNSQPLNASSEDVNNSSNCTSVILLTLSEERNHVENNSKESNHVDRNNGEPFPFQQKSLSFNENVEIGIGY